MVTYGKTIYEHPSHSYALDMLSMIAMAPHGTALRDIQYDLQMTEQAVRQVIKKLMGVGFGINWQTVWDPVTHARLDGVSIAPTCWVSVQSAVRKYWANLALPEAVSRTPPAAKKRRHLTADETKAIEAFANALWEMNEGLRRTRVCATKHRNRRKHDATA